HDGPALSSGAGLSADLAASGVDGTGTAFVRSSWSRRIDRPRRSRCQDRLLLRHEQDACPRRQRAACAGPDRGGVPFSMNDSSRIVVITGGGGGIGAACARAMAREGWHVVVCDIDKGRAEAVAREVGGTGRALDIADAPAVETLASSVEAEIGPCAGLIACAAHLENPHQPEEQSLEEWRRIVDVNVSGSFHTCRAFGGRMAKRGRGAIVTIASITALGSSPLVAYGPSKAALVTMTRNLAVAWGRRQVRVNCVAPGPTLTPAVLAS